MSITNHLTITGNVGKDPRVNVGDFGTVLGFGLAFTPRKKDGDEWKDNGPTLWFDVSAWGDLADKYADDVKQGTRITVSGSIGSREHGGVIYTTLRAESLVIESKPKIPAVAAANYQSTPSSANSGSSAPSDPWASAPFQEEGPGW